MFFCLNCDIIKYVDNYIGLYHDIECKEIYLHPLINCINDTCNTKIKAISVICHPYIYVL